MSVDELGHMTCMYSMSLYSVIIIIVEQVFLHLE